MLQAVIKNGKVIAEEIAPPVVSDYTVLIQTAFSCISGGTELTALEKSSGTMVGKAIDQPEKLAMALSYFRKKGLLKLTAKITQSKNKLVTIGYSCAGQVLAVGKEVKYIKVGDWVAAAGAAYAQHAEYIIVPENLCIKIPAGLELKKAATVAMGGIALHGVRRAGLQTGEYAVVIGCGVLGLLTLRLLNLSGVRTAAIDIDAGKLAFAGDMGAELTVNPTYENQLLEINNWTESHGADAVIITASATRMDIMTNAANMTKRKGKVILVGMAGNNYQRDVFYSKEIDLLISTSYGPGRYDAGYEEKGVDYPYSYVRWTQNRNMAEYLRLLKVGAINLDHLISGSFEIHRVREAFSFLQNHRPKPLMVLLEYNVRGNNIPNLSANRISSSSQITTLMGGLINVAVVGVGGFSQSTHLPNMSLLKNKFAIRAIMDLNGVKARQVEKEYNAEYSTCNYEEILADPYVDLVMICTRHDSHAQYTLKALNAGKHVFVEKPLATTSADLEAIRNFYSTNGDKPVLMVGFNRRYSKFIKEIKKYTANRNSPLYLHYRMNAGYIPMEHWIHENGGRMVGEACHIIDVALFLTDSPISSFAVESLSPKTEKFTESDNKAVLLKFEDGSMAVLEYFALGNKLLPKEYVEVHFDEKSIVLDDFTSLKGFGAPFKDLKSKEPDKGHLEEIKELYEFIERGTGCFPIPFQQLYDNTSLALKL
jgi:predicted dehydrogenase/threonine dehydrogenase-like Zn-dependent dehydrogenase